MTEDTIKTEYLIMNPTLINREKIIHDERDKIIKKNKNFYKKRIFALNKDIFKNNIPSNIDINIIDAYKKFLYLSIKHFQFIDKTDFIQDNYNDLSFNEDNKTDNLPSILEEIPKDIDSLLSNQNYNKQNNTTIDKFLNINSQNTNKQDNNNLELPKILNINLKEESLKKKGIKNKKK
jgi:hypothetical protein